MAIDKKRFLITIFTIGLFTTQIKTSNLDINIYGYFISLLACVFAFTHQPTIKINQLFILLFLLILLILYLPINPATATDQLRYLALIIPPLIVIPWYCNFNFFSAVFIKTSFYLLIAFILLYFLGIGVDAGYSENRIQGLTSEPSALALITSISIIHNLKSYRIIIPLIALILSKSPTVYIIVIFSLCLFLLFNSNNPKTRAVLLIISLSTVVYTFINGLNIDHDFDNIVLNRFMTGMHNIFSLGETGYNPRMESTINSIEFVKNSGNFFNGLGLNSASYLVEGGSGRSLSFPVEIFVSFGLVGLIIYLLLTIRLLTSIKTNDVNIKILTASVISYVNINSAQGIVLQILMLIIFVYFFVKKEQMILINR